MRNEFQRHRKSDKVKWAFTGVAFLLTFVMLAGVFMQLFASDKFKPSNWFTKFEQNEELPEETGGEAVITETVESGGISLMTTSIEPSAYADYGVSAAATSAYTITATVTPNDSVVTDFTWSASFENPSSTWASGKKVSDYVGIGGVGLTATVSCKQAFGEPIIITCAYDFDSSINATCKLDYLKAISSISATGFFDRDNTHAIQDSDYTPILNYTLGVGTIEGEVVADKVYMELTDEAIIYLYDNKFYQCFEANVTDCNWAINKVMCPFNAILKAEFIKYTTESDYFYTSIYDILTNQVNLSSSQEYKDNVNYYKAAWVQLIEDMTNCVRGAITYTYEYNGKVITDSTVYTNYGSFSNRYGSVNSSLLSVSGVSLNNSNLVFGI